VTSIDNVPLLTHDRHSVSYMCSSDGVSSIGLGLETRLETHFCKSRLNLGLEGYRSRSQTIVLRLEYRKEMVC